MASPYSSSSSSSSSVTVISKCTIIPDKKSIMSPLKLSVSDLPMLSCHYIQKGVVLTNPPDYSLCDFVFYLKRALSRTLSYFPALAGRLSTDSDGHVRIISNDAGIDFVHAKATSLTLENLLCPLHDVPDCFKDFFAFDRTLSYDGHFKPLAAVQVTELADGLFLGCSVNHAVTDGTSFWHFFNSLAEIFKGAKHVSKAPDFWRDTAFDSLAVLKLPAGGPTVKFSCEEPLRERIFHFSRAAILKMKFRANTGRLRDNQIISNQLHSGEIRDVSKEISSFQSLSTLLWRAVTRARKLEPNKMTTLRMAANCRLRLNPRLYPYYFGNAIQSIPTVASVGELLSHNLGWGADLLHKNVEAHDDAAVRRYIADWEKQPSLFPLGNFDGASLTIGSSPRFPMYDNDFGWGRPLAIRSGRANKFDGKISAFPGWEGMGSVDLEVVLAPETMAGLEEDSEFMQYVDQ